MLNRECMDKVQNRFDNLIKPVGSLAKLEKLVGMFAGARAKTGLDYPKKVLLVLDYGAANLQEQMLCLQSAKLDEQVVVRCLTVTPELDIEQVVQELADAGVEIVAFGYSGKAIDNDDAEHCARLVCKGVLKAVGCGLPVVLDGYISTYGAYLAYQQDPIVKEYLVAGYKIADSKQAEILNTLGLSELLSLHLQSENGLGALLTFSLLNAGIRAYKDMRTFDEAKVEYALSDLK